MIPEETWLSVLADSPSWEPPALATVVISPHPDDETLGAGGLIAMQRQRGLPVIVIAVTDGEAAYPNQQALGARRAAEQQAALSHLAVNAPSIIRLRLPDSNVREYEDRLTELLRPHVTESTLVIAPSDQDPHPDHQACGRAARTVADVAGAAAAYYLFWAWHWSTLDQVAPLPLRRLILSDSARELRAAALAEHVSQLHWPGGEPVLPEALLAPARRPFETFIVFGR